MEETASSRQAMSDTGGAPEAARRSVETEITDVLVIGGGIAGSSAAFHLARAGIRTTLLERHRLGSGVSARAVGVLSPPVRQPYQQLVFDMGEGAARELWDFSLRSVEGLTDLLRTRGEDCSVELDRSGGYVIAEPHTRAVIAGSYDAMRRAGLPVRWLTPPELKDATGGRRFSGGYVVEGGGSLNPGAASRAVASAAQSAGARLVEGVTARTIEHCPGGFRATTDGGEIVASAVVYATHLDGTAFLGNVGADLSPVRGQAFTTAPVARRFRGAFSTEWKTNVWRQRPDGRIVVSGWRHHAADRARSVEGSSIDRSLQNELRWWFEAAFPDLAPLPVEAEWSGMWSWTPDMLPLVGALPGRPGEWIVSGFGGEGFAFAFESGRAVAHAMIGDHAVPGASLLDPARLSRPRVRLAVGD
jgi:glycine/D-amino acid oxidase-like deaminating enzyme